MSLLDLLLIQEGEAVGCDICDASEESPAHVRCGECSVYLCELHEEAHKGARDTKQHVLLSLGKFNRLFYPLLCAEKFQTRLLGENTHTQQTAH